jgi:glycosyltransferase involved in cell wall biosynthesis
LREIWPLVLGRAPHARLRIFGRIAETVRLPLPDGVTAEGPVADLAVLAGPDMIGLAPTRLASGISIKIADYLALGQPVVSYPAGVAGFGDALQSAIALADTPEGFAQATAELLADPSLRHARSQAGLSLVEQLFATSGVEAAFAGSARTASAA